MRSCSKNNYGEERTLSRHSGCFKKPPDQGSLQGIRCYQWDWDLSRTVYLPPLFKLSSEGCIGIYYVYICNLPSTEPSQSLKNKLCSLFLLKKFCCIFLSSWWLRDSKKTLACSKKPHAVNLASKRLRFSWSNGSARNIVARWSLARQDGEDGEASEIVMGGELPARCKGIRFMRTYLEDLGGSSQLDPVSKWLVTPIYKPWKGHLEGEQPQLRDLLTMVINRLLYGMILLVRGQLPPSPRNSRPC